MEFLGLRIAPSLTVLTPKESLELSTRYDDRDITYGESEVEKLCNLSFNLNAELRLHAPYLLSLEELAERYYEEGLLALSDRNIGYYMRYASAYEQCKIVIHNWYNLIPVVLV